MLRKFLDNRCKERSFRTGSVDTCNKIAEQNGSHLVLGKQAEELLDMFGLLNSNVNAGAILLMVLRLRQCCSHLSLLREVRLCFCKYPKETWKTLNGLFSY